MEQSKRLQWLTFNLGFACNFRCKYCFRQHNEKPVLPSKPTEKLKQWLRKNAIRYKRITINGGEPLLYKQAIYELFDCVPKWMYKVVITNGSLLDADFVSYCNENNITISISHDGACTKALRGVDVLETKLDLIRSINNLGFHTVITKYNLNIIDNIRYIDKIVNRNDIIHTINNYMEDGNNDPLIEGFDYELYRKYYVEFLFNYKRKHKGFGFGNNDGILGTQILLNGDIVELKTLKKYGTIFDDEEILYNNIKPDLDGCDCKYKDICNLKKQLASPHMCKLHHMVMEGNSFYKGVINEDLDRDGC